MLVKMLNSQAADSGIWLTTLLWQTVIICSGICFSTKLLKLFTKRLNVKYCPNTGSYIGIFLLYMIYSLTPMCYDSSRCEEDKD